MSRVHILEMLNDQERTAFLTGPESAETFTPIPNRIAERFPYHVSPPNLPTPAAAVGLPYRDDYVFISNDGLPESMLGGWFREKRDAMLFRMIFGGDFSDNQQCN